VALFTTPLKFDWANVAHAISQKANKNTDFFMND